jgi:hypothetical protein
VRLSTTAYSAKVRQNRFHDAIVTSERNLAHESDMRSEGLEQRSKLRRAGGDRRKWLPGTQRTFRRTLSVAYNETTRDPASLARLNPQEETLKRIGVGILISLLACATLSGAARSASPMASDPAVGPTIHIDDVDSFYKVYDAAGGHPTADQLQHDYLDPGSDGLHEFAKLRNISGTRIAETLASHPEIYSGAKRCMVVLPRVRQRLKVALHNLGRLYPEARFPPVTIAVGRGQPVGVGGGPATGVLIGLEAL